MLFAVFAGLMSSLSHSIMQWQRGVSEEQGNFLACLTKIHHIDH